jgi:hypothetical protein
MPTMDKNIKIEKVLEKSLKLNPIKKQVFTNAIPAVTKFVPYIKQTVIIRDSQIPIINQWVNPDSKWLDEKINSIDMPEIYKHYFSNIFPNSEEREIVIQWIIQGQRGKLQKFLYLVSRGGEGKGTLEELFSLMLLKENIKKIDNNEFLKDSRFNGGYDKATLLVLDEVIIDSSAGKSKLKQLINNATSITSKGVDSKDSELHCNLLICSNLKDGIILEDTSADRRRFYIPKVTSVGMNEYCKTYNKDFNASDYRKEMLKPENVKQFYNWCLNQKETINFVNEMVTPTHLDLINSSAPGWAQEVKCFFDKFFIKNKIIKENDVKEWVLENTNCNKINSKTLVETILKFYGSEIVYKDRGSSFKEDRRIFIKKEDSI